MNNSSGLAYWGERMAGADSRRGMRRAVEWAWKHRDGAWAMALKRPPFCISITKQEKKQVGARTVEKPFEGGL